MIPIRDAFDQTGRERFKGEWTGEEIGLLDDWPSVATLPLLSASKRAAFHRCTAIVAFMAVELEAGRVVAVTTDASHRRHDVAAHHWRDSAHDGHWQDGAQNLADYLTDLGTSRFIRVVSDKLIAGSAPGLTPTRAKSGRKPKADWDAYKLMFVAECAHGMPGDDHPSWDTIAAAVEWLRNVARDDRASKYKSADDVPFETARDYINRWLRELAAVKGGN